MKKNIEHLLTSSMASFKPTVRKFYYPLTKSLYQFFWTNYKNRSDFTKNISEIRHLGKCDTDGK